MNRTRALGLLLGHLADRVLGDPASHHPVAGFGGVAATLEQRTYGDARGRGVAHTLVLVGSAVVLGTLIERLTRDRPAAHAVATATTAWIVLGGTSLGREAGAVHSLLHDGDLAAARQRMTHLVGRDTSVLDGSGVSRGTVESVAENTSDAVVAPLFWGAVAGMPGMLGYRAANTLDAMVGHRGTRYGRFGWASARLDDVLNLPGARATGLLTAGLAPTVGGSPGAALRAWRRDAAAHPSPNAGVVEAAFAGALGVRLGGRNTYPHGVEDRVLLGDGPPAAPADIDRARRLSRDVGTTAAVLAAAVAVILGRRPSRRRTRRR